VDIKSKEKRSKNMAKIRSKNTRPEKYIRSALFKNKFRFRVNYDVIEGHPDIYLTKAKVAIFVHGCYWHRHNGCQYAYTPKSNVNFWLSKFTTNKKRDTIVYETLCNKGIRVLVIWECTVRRMWRDNEIHSGVIAQIEDFILADNLQYLEL
jgi:DNA mismatch endonuclease (patch repair protein)